MTISIKSFLKNWIDMVEKPITENKNQGFLMSNDMRIFFKNTTLTRWTKMTLKNKGIKLGWYK